MVESELSGHVKHPHFFTRLYVITANFMYECSHNEYNPMQAFQDILKKLN